MWTTRSQPLLNGQGVKVFIDLDSVPLQFSEVLCLWQGDEGFRTFFISLLAKIPFPAFRWEMPPVTLASQDRSFECVLLNSPGLVRSPDPEAFSSHFAGASAVDRVVVFPNLGNDALLVVPCPFGDRSAYGHLAAFVREAPESQKQALWALVGQTMRQRLGSAPIWLNTAGAGVPWLHVRLDERPKYYHYSPYRDPTDV